MLYGLKALDELEFSYLVVLMVLSSSQIVHTKKPSLKVSDLISKFSVNLELIPLGELIYPVHAQGNQDSKLLVQLLSDS